MNKLIITLAVSALAVCTFAQERGEGGRRGGQRDRGRMQANPEAKLHRFSTTIERLLGQLLGDDIYETR